MGLLLLIPGIVFLVNGTEWFSGENAVGLALVIIGVVILAIQLAIFAAAAKTTKKAWDRF